MYCVTFCSGLYFTCLFVFTACGGERQPRSAPSLAPGSTHQHCFLKFPLSLINITVCTRAALINQSQVAVLKMAVATTVSALQSASLPTRRGRHRGAESKQQALCSAFNVRGGNLALFCGYTSLSPQGRAQRRGGRASGLTLCLLIGESPFLFPQPPCSVL